MAATADKVVSKALDEVGTKESGNNNQKYGKYFNCNGVAWCCFFVDWCFYKAYGKTTAKKLLCSGSAGATGACATLHARMKKKGRIKSKKATPKVGDIIFFNTSAGALHHVGIVRKVDKTYVYTVEGNSSDKVAKRKYKRTNYSRINSYGRPAYDTAKKTVSTNALSSLTSDSKKTLVYTLNRDNIAKDVSGRAIQGFDIIGNYAYLVQCKKDGSTQFVSRCSLSGTTMKVLDYMIITNGGHSQTISTYTSDGKIYLLLAVRRNTSSKTNRPYSLDLARTEYVPGKKYSYSSLPRITGITSVRIECCIARDRQNILLANFLGTKDKPNGKADFYKIGIEALNDAFNTAASSSSKTIQFSKVKKTKLLDNFVLSTLYGKNAATRQGLAVKNDFSKIYGFSGSGESNSYPDYARMYEYNMSTGKATENSLKSYFPHTSTSIPEAENILLTEDEKYLIYTINDRKKTKNKRTKFYTYKL